MRYLHCHVMKQDMCYSCWNVVEPYVFSEKVRHQLSLLSMITYNTSIQDFRYVEWCSVSRLYQQEWVRHGCWCAFISKRPPCPSYNRFIMFPDDNLYFSDIQNIWQSCHPEASKPTISHNMSASTVLSVVCDCIFHISIPFRLSELQNTKSLVLNTLENNTHMLGEDTSASPLL